MGLNEEYKKRHKPIAEDKTKYHQGYYIPELHPEKCLGGGEIIYRSGLEHQLFNAFFDKNPSVRRWQAEVLAVPYLNPIKNFDKCIREHMDPSNPYNWALCNYNIDVWMEYEYAGKLYKIFIEIKPYNQTLPPLLPPPGSKPRQFKAYNEAAKTYAVNRAKWEAAKKYCEARDCYFIIFTERYAKKPNDLNNLLIAQLFLSIKREDILVL